MIEPTRFNPNSKTVTASIEKSTDDKRFIRSYDINLKSEEFTEVINDIVKKYDIDEIVETGTFNGLGSTTVFANTGKYVFTIECNYNNFVTAIQNLARFENVCVVNGLSVSRKDLIDFLLNEKFDAETSYDSQYPKTFYMREIVHNVVVDDALSVFAKNNNRQIVFLDSAGGVGYCEFNHFMSFGDDILKNKILVLDDIDHIKHVRSVDSLKANGYEVNISKDKRFAWCDLSVKNTITKP